MAGGVLIHSPREPGGVPASFTDADLDAAIQRRTAMLALAIILLVLWALGFFAFHVAGGLIHLLLVVALVVFVVNLVRGRSAI